MQPKSQAQSVVDYLAGRIGQLEIEKAILQAQLEEKSMELDSMAVMNEA